MWRNPGYLIKVLKNEETFEKTGNGSPFSYVPFGQRCRRILTFMFLSCAVISCSFPAPEQSRLKLPEPLVVDQFLPAERKQAELGRLLFYDKILSGNSNISCATCHHHDLNGTDGLSLGIGEGGEGLGRNRTTGTGSNRIKERIPRNSPALWNLGHQSIETLFHDGRLAISTDGFVSPAGEQLPAGLNHIDCRRTGFVFLHLRT